MATQILSHRHLAYLTFTHYLDIPSKGRENKTNIWLWWKSHYVSIEYWLLLMQWMAILDKLHSSEATKVFHHFSWCKTLFWFKKLKSLHSFASCLEEIGSVKHAISAQGAWRQGWSKASYSLEESHLKWPLPKPKHWHQSLKPVSDNRSHSSPME